MATFVVKSNLNVTVSIIKNDPDDTQFVYIISMNICLCPLVNICNIAVNQMLASNVLSTDTLFKAQHRGVIYFVVRYIKAQLMLYNIYM